MIFIDFLIAFRAEQSYDTNAIQPNARCCTDPVSFEYMRKRAPENLRENG